MVLAIRTGADTTERAPGVRPGDELHAVTSIAAKPTANPHRNVNRLVSQANAYLRMSITSSRRNRLPASLA
jgi:hypothetical protein